MTQPSGPIPNPQIVGSQAADFTEDDAFAFTLRDLFAACAIGGLMNSWEAGTELDEAKIAYNIADAMLQMRTEDI